MLRELIPHSYEIFVIAFALSLVLLMSAVIQHIEGAVRSAYGLMLSAGAINVFAPALLMPVSVFPAVLSCVGAAVSLVSIGMLLIAFREPGSG